MDSMKLMQGDCLDKLKELDDNSVDSIVTDPPYGLSFMGKAWDNAVPSVDVWEECLRVLKPGGHLLAFAGTRTQHRMAVAIEDAGFEIRDMIAWVYGSGFPKSANVSKMIDQQEKNKWLNIIKAIDNIDTAAILEAWKKYLKSASNAGLIFQSGSLEAGPLISSCDSAPAHALLQANQKNSDAVAMLVELSLIEALHTSGAGCSAPLPADESGKQDPVKSVKIQPQNDQAKSTPIGIAPCGVREWQSENTAGKLKAAEALKTWLGRKKSSNKAATDALCAALTDDLRAITLSQSKTFQSLDTSRQTECASAITATITESTAARLISFMVDTLRNKAIDKAAGAEREVVGPGPYASRGRVNGTNQCSVGDSLNSAITTPATESAKQWDGWGTALKPALEPITVARKPLAKGNTVAANVLAHGTGAINVDGCRVAYQGDYRSPARASGDVNSGGSFGGGVVKFDDASAEAQGRWPANLIHDGSDEVVGMFPVTHGAGTFRRGKKHDSGFLSELPVETVQKPAIDGGGNTARFFYCAKASKKDRDEGLDGTCTVKYTVDKSTIGDLSCRDVSTALVESLRKVTSGLTLKWAIGECGESITGQCPADSLSTTLTTISKITPSKILSLLTPLPTSEFTAGANYATENGGSPAVNAGSSSESRPISTSGSQAESARGVSLVVSQMLLRISDGENWKPTNNIHSTVKPTDLMRYLVRLVTPPGGVVLDPFMGSGSTGKAARLEGFRFIGIELDPEYFAIAEQRITKAKGEQE